MATKIRVGTCSWSDPEFLRDWYPKGLPAGERLGWYARHFDWVEVNSSFYAIPAAKLVERWSKQTPEGFLFDVKLHKLFSRHAAKPDALPKDLRMNLKVTSRGSVVATEELVGSMAKRFQEAIEPLRESGKLGALLLQMSPSFSSGAHRLEELEQVFAAFHGYKVAVELRSRGWVEGEERQEDTFSFLRERGVPLVLTDLPESEHFTIMPRFDVVTDPSLAYLRLHGRNEHGFIHGKSVAERFDYAYDEDELGEIAERVQGLAQQAKEVHVGFNNNHSDFAPKGAAQLKRMLGA